MSSHRRVIRLLAGLATLLMPTIGVPGVPGPANVAAKTPSYDVRGVWEWDVTYTCAGCEGTRHASVTIQRQDRRTGAVRGSYSLAAGEVGGIRNPPYDTTMAGTVSGRRMTLKGIGSGDWGGVVSGTLAKRAASSTVPAARPLHGP